MFKLNNLTTISNLKINESNDVKSLSNQDETNDVSQLIEGIKTTNFNWVQQKFKNKFLQAFSLKFNAEVIKTMLSLGLVYAAALFIINLNYSIDIILLDILSQSFETGIYTKGAAITQYLWQIPMMLSTIVFARSAVAKSDYQFSL